MDNSEWISQEDRQEWLDHWRKKTGSPTFGQPRRLISNEPIPYDQVFYTFRARDLFDKGGFYDGDIFMDEFLEYLHHEKGIKRYPGNDKYWYADCLKDVITEFLLPLIPYKITLEVVTTMHNQVRCFEVEGVEEDDLGTFRDICEGVEVRLSWAEIKSFIDRKIAEGLLK